MAVDFQLEYFAQDNYKNFHVFPLDHLMRKNLRKNLIQKYNKKNMSIKVYEFLYKTYAFSIKIY